MGEDTLGTLQRTLADVLGAGLTTLDLVLLAVAVLVALGGLRRGLLARVAAWAGVVLGIALSGRTVPLALELADEAGIAARMFVAVLALTLTVAVTTAGLQLASAPLRRLLTLGPLSLLDRALGAVASVVVLGLLLWLVAPAAAAIPGRVSSEVRASAVLGTIDTLAPPPADVTRTLRTLLGGDRFPDVFASLAPTPEPSDPPADVDIDPVVLARAMSAPASVRAIGCGRSYAGSAFAVDADHLITNAHVVAGAREVELRTHDGRRLEATVVVFDKDRDLALLTAPGHALPALPLRDADVGTEGAVIGFPGGVTTPRVAAVRVDRSVTGVGRDIYGRDRTERSLHFLAAELRSGDSGAPVVDRDGRAFGVVFAVSPDVRAVAYALAVEEVEAVLAATREPGVTGRCV